MQVLDRAVSLALWNLVELLFRNIACFSTVHILHVEQRVFASGPGIIFSLLAGV